LLGVQPRCAPWAVPGRQAPRGIRILKRALAIGIGAVLLVSPAASASYRDTRFDPNDVVTPNDLRSTTRAVVAPHERRVLRIVLRGYEAWPSYRTDDSFQALIRLDTRGGVHADASLHCSSGGDIGCLLSDYDGPLHVARHRARFVCRVPIRALHVNKRIRWKVITTYQDRRHPDYVPDDRGWFV
jgi:hypothetical protein